MTGTDESRGGLPAACAGDPTDHATEIRRIARGGNLGAADGMLLEDHLDALVGLLAEERLRANRLELVLYPDTNLNRDQRRAMRYGTGLHSQLDDSIRQGG